MHALFIYYIIILCLNHFLRIMFSGNFCTPVFELYRALDFLSLDINYEIELAKFLHQLQHQILLEIFLQNCLPNSTLLTHTLLDRNNHVINFYPNQ